MRNYQAWLPAAALDDPSVGLALADTVRQWSARWFVRGQIGPAGGLVEPVPPCPVADGVTWFVLDDELAIEVPVASRMALASLMLDRTIDDRSLNGADRQVITDLATACLDDLCRRLAMTFRLPADVRWAELEQGQCPTLDRPRGCRLGGGEQAPLLRLVLSTDLMISLIKSRLAVPAPRGVLAPVAAGLAAQSVTVSALLGRCSLTLADLVGLSEGDVLVFDSEAGSALPLAVDAAGQGVGRCTVEQAGDHFLLKLLEPPIR